MRAKPSDIAPALLGWYDAHARVLPWRSPPRTAPPDPYRVWLSEVMLQQTSVAAVRPRFAAFLARWPDVAALAAADDADVLAAWAGLGYYARARNMLAAARAAAASGFPASEAALRALPGVGGYTAAAVAAIAFGQRAVVVDANVERVVARLFAVATPLPGARPAIYAHADAITPDARAGDFAQAMMDLGSTICTPRGPRCLLCPLRDACSGFASGTPRSLSGQARQAGPPAAARHRLLGDARRFGAARPAPGEGSARRDARAADRAVGSGAAGAGGGAVRGRLAGGRAPRRARLHALPPRTRACERGGGGA